MPARGLLFLCAAATASAADLTGVWIGTFMDAPAGFEFRQAGRRVTGVATLSICTCILFDGQVTANGVTFALKIEDRRQLFNLTLDGDQLTGSGLQAKRQIDTPGPLTGLWRGAEPLALRLYQDGQAVKGYLIDPDGHDSVFTGTFQDDRLAFKIGVFRYELKLSAESLRGQITDGRGPLDELRLNKVRNPKPSTGFLGRWTGTLAVFDNGVSLHLPITLQLHRYRTHVTGTFGEKGRPTPIVDARIQGDQLIFRDGDAPSALRIELKLSGDDLNGTATRMVDGKPETAAITAVRRFD